MKDMAPRAAQRDDGPRSGPVDLEAYTLIEGLAWMLAAKLIRKAKTGLPKR